MHELEARSSKLEDSNGKHSSSKMKMNLKDKIP